LATVLAAAATRGPGAIPAATVAGWGVQVLGRERTERTISPAASRARDRAGPMYASSPDPVAEVIRFLAAAGNPSAAAAVLPDQPSWDLVLRRPELAVSERAELGRFVELIGEADGAAGDAAVRAGLEALGAGIADEDPNHWEVTRSMADAVSLPLAAALAQHPDVVPGVLLDAADGGGPSTADGAALRALGYVSIDPGVGSVLGASVSDWARAHAELLATSSRPVAPLVLGSFVAVREYGQRLAYALHGFELRDAAAAAQTFWNATVGLLVNLLPKGAGEVGGVIEPFAAHLLGYDGIWDNGQDTGLTFDRDDAVAAAEVQLSPDGVHPAGLFAAGAAAGYDRVARILGLPEPPVPPEWHWEQVLLDATPMPDFRDLMPDEYLRSHGIPPG
jgi:hypothetical protein